MNRFCQLRREHEKDLAHLELDRLPRETFPDKCRLVYHSFPALSLMFTRLDHLEHFLFRNTPDLRQRNRILCSSVFSPIFDSRAESFGILSVSCVGWFIQRSHLLTLTIKQISGQGTLLDGPIVLLLDIPLIMRLESFLHLDLLSMSSSVMQLGFVPEHLLGLL